LSSVDRRDIHNSDLPVLCRSCEARHKGICGALNPEQLVLLSRQTNRRTLEPGETFIAADDEITTHANILSGVAKLSKLLPDGRQQIVGLQFAPDLLGRVFRRKSENTVEAATHVRVCTFPKRVLEAIIAQSPETEHRLHEQTLRELDEAREWMITLGRKTASERVASFLNLIASHFDPEKSEAARQMTFDIPLRRTDIADFLGLTIETVSRRITKFRQAGIIQVENNRTVTILDPARLREACGSEI
jgi:CRP/FNR family transcriptional regulator, anaerobic regulatory protein